MPLSIAEQMIARRKGAQKVIVTCYGERKEFATASKAINFFTLAVNGCDPQSSECGRYQRILNRPFVKGWCRTNRISAQMGT